MSVASTSPAVANAKAPKAPKTAPAASQAKVAVAGNFMKPADFVAAMRAAEANQSSWIGGLPLDKYSDVKDSSGALKVFFTRATENETDPAKRKLGGRYVVDSLGREKKLYRAMEAEIPAGLPGISVTNGLININNASFAIDAVEDESREPEEYPANSGKMQRPRKHVLRTK